MTADGRASKGRTAARSLRYPPGATGSPYVNFFRYARDPLAFLTALGREYGDIARFALPSGDYVLLNNPDLIKDVLPGTKEVRVLPLRCWAPPLHR